MKKTACIILVLFVALGCLTGCGGAKTPRQKADAILSNHTLPTNEEGVKAIRAKLDEKLSELDAAAAQKGVAGDVYFATMRNDIIPNYIANLIDVSVAQLSSYSGDEYKAKVKEVSLYILEMYNEADDLTERTEGYIGICRALCEGSDMFNMSEDAKDLTGSGAWPSGYFFDSFLPEMDAVSSFRVCEDYLRGYGLNDATLCSIGVNSKSKEDTLAYIEKVKEKGLYTYMQVEEGNAVYWYGSWIGEDGSKCYLWVEYAPIGEGSLIQDLTGGNAEVSILAGNFNFNICIDTAVLVFFM